MSKTVSLYYLAPNLKAGMKCSVVVNEPLYEVEDNMLLESGNVRLTFSADHVNGVSIKRFKATDLVEVHLTLDEAVAEFHRLSTAEAVAFARAYELGEQRAQMAGLARSLGWRG